jgi:hypothetical protein
MILDLCATSLRDIKSCLPKTQSTQSTQRKDPLFILGALRLGVFHERVGFVKQNLPLSSLNPLFGADPWEGHNQAARPQASSTDLVPDREGSVKGARFWRGFHEKPF